MEYQTDIIFSYQKMRGRYMHNVNVVTFAIEFLSHSPCILETISNTGKFSLLSSLLILLVFSM